MAKLQNKTKDNPKLEQRCQHQDHRQHSRTQQPRPHRKIHRAVDALKQATIDSMPPLEL